MLPTIVLTELGKRGWSDPVKKANAIKNIPIGRLAGNRKLKIFGIECNSTESANLYHEANACFNFQLLIRLNVQIYS